jgi:hypothetical protein
MQNRAEWASRVAVDGWEWWHSTEQIKAVRMVVVGD